MIEWLIPLALLVLLLRAVMGPAFFSSTYYFGTPGDTGQYMWFMGWMWWAIERGQDPMFTSAFHYPTPIALMDYTAVPALGLLFGWLYPLVGMLFTYNLIIVLNYLLIFVFGKLTLRELGVGGWLSGAGGLLFCLLPYVTAQETLHLDLAFIAPLFIITYLLVRVIRAERRPTWLDGLALGLALVFAFYTYLETFLTLGICLLAVYVCAVFSARRAAVRLTRRLARPTFLIGIGAPLLLTIPGLLNFFAGQTAQPLDFSYLPVTFSADLLSFVVPTQLYLVHTDATTTLTSHFTGNLSEWDSYLSAPLIALAVFIAVRFWSDLRIRILANAALVMLILSLGPFPHFDGVWTYPPLPWIFVLLFHTPFLQSALPIRLALYTECLLMTLVLLGLQRYARQARETLRSAQYRVRLGLAFMTLALVALCWLPRIPLAAQTMPRAAQLLGNGSPAAAYLAHQPVLVLNNHLDGFSTVMGILAQSQNYALRTSNVYGYGQAGSASNKVNIAFILDTDGQRTTRALRQYLPQLGVSRVMFVAVDDQPLDPQRLTEISGYLGAPLYNDRGLVVIWNAQPVAASGGATPPAN